MNNFTQKLAFFKKMKDLNNKQLMEVVQDIVYKFPFTIKDINSDEVKIRVDELDNNQFMV